MGALIFVVAIIGLAMLAIAINRGRISDKALELTLKGLVVLGAFGLLLFALSMIFRFWGLFLILALVAGALAIGQVLFKGKR
jgi:hypothetical protein